MTKKFYSISVQVVMEVQVLPKRHQLPVYTAPHTRGIQSYSKTTLWGPKQRNVTDMYDIPVVFYKLNTKYNYQSKHNKNYCIMLYNVFHNYMFRPFFRPSSGCVH